MGRIAGVLAGLVYVLRLVADLLLIRRDLGDAGAPADSDRAPDVVRPAEAGPQDGAGGLGQTGPAGGPEAWQGAGPDGGPVSPG